MNTRITVTRAAIALILAGSTIAGGIVHADSSAPAATVTDYVRSSSSNTNLSTVGGVNTTIVSVSLPAGSWVLSADATAVNFGPSDYTRCKIYNGSTFLTQATTMVGDQSLPGNMGPGAYVASVGTIGTIKTATAVTASLECSHDNATPSGDAVPYIDADAVLWAHRSAGLG